MLWFILACRPPAPPPALPRPPVVVVTLDTTRADRLGCYGRQNAETPNLDALAARGLVFEHAFTPVPLTIPAHSAIFTGLWPPRHGVRDNGDFRLSTSAMTLAEAMRNVGYRTHASVGAFVTQAHWGFGQGFDGYDDDLGVPADRLSWVAERRAAAVVDDALVALGKGSDFLWVHLFDAHAPYDPPPPFRARFADHPYDGEIAYMDQELGRLLGAIPPEAWIVVAGDHGEGLGEGGEEQHGLLLGDATLHVPLILAGPGLAPGRVDRPVSLVDIYPTLQRLLDLPSDGPLDGVDLLPEGGLAESDGRPGVYAESLYGLHHFGWTPLYAILTSTGTLVRGARDEVAGEVGDRARHALGLIPTGSPAWEATPVSLDLTQVEQLQALGYMGTSASVAEAAETSIDPRDGIGMVRRMGQIHTLPPERQITELRAILDATPSMRDARFRLAMLLAQAGQLDEALAELDSAWRLVPDSTAAIAMGSLWLQAGQPDEALYWFREALLLDPRAPTARAGEVEALVGLGRHDEAEAAADLALADEPENSRLVLARARLALARGDAPGPWLDPVAQVARLRPYEPGSLELAGLLHGAAGATARAEEYLRLELEWRPGNLPARLALVDLLREQGRLVDVVKTLRPLVALQPQESRWQAFMARAWLDMGRKDRAAPFLLACAGDPLCPGDEP